MIKKIIIIVGCILILFSLSGCTGNFYDADDINLVDNGDGTYNAIYKGDEYKINSLDMNGVDITNLDDIIANCVQFQDGNIMCGFNDLNTLIINKVLSPIDTNWQNSPPQDNEYIELGNSNDANVGWNGSQTIFNTSGDFIINGSDVGINNLTPDATFDVITPTASGREKLLNFTISDAGNDNFFISNATTATGRFLPVFGGYVESVNNAYSMGFQGFVSAGDDASDSSATGIIDFTAMRSDYATDPINGTRTNIENRKLFSWRNLADLKMYMGKDGNLYFPNDGQGLFIGAGNDYSVNFNGSDLINNLLSGDYYYLNGDIVIDNAKTYRAKDSGGTPRGVFKLDEGDDIIIGSTTISDMNFYSGAGTHTTFYHSGVNVFEIDPDGDVIIPNNHGYRIYDTGGTQRPILLLNNSNNILIGSTQVNDLEFYSSNAGDITFYDLTTPVFQIDASRNLHIPNDNATLCFGAGGEFCESYDGTDAIFALSSGTYNFNGGGKARINTTQSASPYTVALEIGNRHTTANQGSSILFPSSTTEGYGARIAGIREVEKARGALLFLTNDNLEITPTERMRISGDGTIAMNYADQYGSNVILTVKGQDDLGTSKGLKVINDSEETMFEVNNAGGIGVGIENDSTSQSMIVRSEGASIYPIYLYQYNGGAGSPLPGFVGLGARGTIASPTAVQSGDYLFASAGRGYHSGGDFTGGSSGVISIHASENFTSTANGTELRFATTKKGTTARSVQLVVDDVGNLIFQADDQNISMGTGNDFNMGYNGTDMIYDLGSGNHKFIRGDVNVNDNLGIIGNAYQSGNYFGNQIYGEMYDYNTTGNTISLSASGVYTRITGFKEGKLNGFSFNDSNLITNYAGKYLFNYSMSFEGGNNNDYGIKVFRNDENIDKCYTQRTTSSTNKGVISINCIAELTVNDKINVRIEDEADPLSNPVIYFSNLSITRVGN